VRFNFRRRQSGAYDVHRGYESLARPSRVEFADCLDADLSGLAMRFQDERGGEPISLVGRDFDLLLGMSE
jgi:hypothetical protein